MDSGISNILKFDSKNSLINIELFDSPPQLVAIGLAVLLHVGRGVVDVDAVMPLGVVVVDRPALSLVGAERSARPNLVAK